MSGVVVEFCALRGGGGEHETAMWATGVVVTDMATARAVHESAHLLEDAGTEDEAGYRALLRALDHVEPLAPTEIELRCHSHALVEALTGGGSAGDGEVDALLERVTIQLLQVGLWRIRRVDAADLRRPAELARKALVQARGDTDEPPAPDAAADDADASGRKDSDIVELDAATARARRDFSRTGVPQWTVTFAEDAGPRCPAACHAGQRFGFGPDTPEGFCVYAMAAVVEDGPLNWSDPTQERMTTLCPHCDVPFDIEIVEGQ